MSLFSAKVDSASASASASAAWHASRDLQAPVFPNYTSPPTDYALACTPAKYRSEEFMTSARQAAKAGLCDADTCQIIFRPSKTTTTTTTTTSYSGGKIENIEMLQGSSKTSAKGDHSDDENQQADKVPNNRQLTASTDHSAPKVGVVFFGGGFVDPRAYSPVAQKLADDYGLPVVIPIFDHDFAIPFGQCSTGRLSLAADAFPDVEKWIVGGHSAGAVAAQMDVQAALLASDDSVDGLFLMGSYLSPDTLPPFCGKLDFSDSGIPMALVYASKDTNAAPSLATSHLDLYSDEPLLMNIVGGNHRQFGSYNDTLRHEFFPNNPIDGVPFIPEHVQIDMSVTAIAHVASRAAAGLDLPKATH